MAGMVRSVTCPVCKKERVVCAHSDSVRCLSCASASKFPSVSERFWSRISKHGPTHPIHGVCWIWLGRLDVGGYGHIGLKGKRIGAHRYGWEIHKGKIPDSLDVLHRCDNPSCVNPKHLFLGTQADNVKDMDDKGRRNPARGQDNGMAKLTNKQREYVKREYRKGRGGFFARMFGVTREAIRYIAKN